MTVTDRITGILIEGRKLGFSAQETADAIVEALPGVIPDLDYFDFQIDNDQKDTSPEANEDFIKLAAALGYRIEKIKADEVAE